MGRFPTAVPASTGQQGAGEAGPAKPQGQDPKEELEAGVWLGRKLSQSTPLRPCSCHLGQLPCWDAG